MAGIRPLLAGIRPLCPDIGRVTPAREDGGHPLGTVSPARRARERAAVTSGMLAPMPARKVTAPAQFAGFARNAPGFFHALAVEMSREWFAEHKAEYEALWVQPFTALLGEVAKRLAPAYKGVALTEPKLFRIHRDVRFGKDKTPYKTHVGGLV